MGELLVDMVPTQRGSGLSAARTFQWAAGGAPANVAAAATRLGADAGLVATVGDDPFGEGLIAELRSAGVDTTFVRQVARPTALAFVDLAEDGERDFLFYGDDPAHDALTPELAVAAVEALAATGGGILHFGSVCLAREPARSATSHAIDAAVAASCLVSFDVNLRQSFWDDLATARDVIGRFLGRAQLVKLSLEEAAFLAGDERAEHTDVVADLLAGGAELVVVSRGQAGATAHTEKNVVSAAAPAVEADDTTGAGDALWGAVLAATLAEPDLWSDPTAATGTLERACSYAALSTTRRGGIPSYPTSDELESYLVGGGAT